jgi:YidC/Oxa1 family membrane protein insertase
MKRKIMATILLVLLLATSGCGKNKYIKDESNKIVKYEATGQTLQTDILCKPNDEKSELYKEYAKYNDQLDNKLEKLPKCKDFKITSNKTNSLWQFLFVKPVAYLIIKLGNLVGNLGISLILIGLAIRIVLLPLQVKSLNQSKNMQKAQPELAKIERKYRDKTDNESLMMKSQETVAIYKKYKISPVLGCLLSFIQLPLFFAFLQAIYRIPTIYQEKLFGWNLGMTPMKGIELHNYSYLILVILIAVTTYFSFNFTMRKQQNIGASTPEMQNQMSMMTRIMTIMIIVTSFSLPTAIGLYWIVTYAFIFVQTAIVNKINRVGDNKSNNGAIKSLKERLKEKEGMKYGKDN